MKPIRKLLWLQVAGCGLLITGAFLSVALYLLGWICLLPGSLLAVFIPRHAFAGIRFSTPWGPDDVGLDNLMYLPIAVSCNILLALLTRFVQRRYRSRNQEHHAESGRA